MGAPVIDARQHRDQPHDIEQGREPRPGGTAQLRRPVVGPAGRGQRGTKLRHTQCYEQRSDRSQRPAQSHFQRAAHLQTIVKKGDGARENGNDGKGNGEVRKAAHAAQQFLGVTKALEFPSIPLGLGLLARPGRRQCVLSLPMRFQISVCLPEVKRSTILFFLAASVKKVAGLGCGLVSLGGPIIWRRVLIP